MCLIRWSFNWLENGNLSPHVSQMKFMSECLYLCLCNPLKYISKQECIPVGCVPAARWPYAGGLLLGGVCSWEVSALRGVSALSGVSALVGCLLLGDVCSWGGCLLLGGVCSRGVSALGGCLLFGGWYPSVHWGRHPPLWTEWQTVQKYYLGHNFIAASNNIFLLFTLLCIFFCYNWTNKLGLFSRSYSCWRHW